MSSGEKAAAKRLHNQLLSSSPIQILSKEKDKRAKSVFKHKATIAKRKVYDTEIGTINITSACRLLIKPGEILIRYAEKKED
jgi:hypothetical protein